MQHSSRLALWHYWVAFAVFLPAVVLGAWQMLMRSPLPAPLDDSDAYYASVTLHGTAMAYVVTTFFIMGFGYAVAATSLGRPIRGMTAAWIGFAICLLGTVMAVVAILSGQASVLYTFYPPLLASALVLWRRVPAHRRLDDLGRADDRQHVGLEARQSRASRAARDVRDHCDRISVGMGRGRRRPRTRRHICCRGPSAGAI